MYFAGVFRHDNDTLLELFFKKKHAWLPNLFSSTASAFLIIITLLIIAISFNYDENYPMIMLKIGSFLSIPIFYDIYRLVYKLKSCILGLVMKNEDLLLKLNEKKSEK